MVSVDADHIDANQLIQAARLANKNGNRSAARHLAQRAILKAGDLAEPWLILAEVASPHARLYYLRQTEMINSAKKGSGPVKRHFLRAGAITLCAMLVLGALAWFTWRDDLFRVAQLISLAPTRFSDSSAPLVLTPTTKTTGEVGVAQPVLATPTRTIPFMPTSSPSPTKTETPLPEMSPTPTETLIPSPTPTATQDPHAPNTYTVKRGETLDSIASKFGCDLDELMRVNYIEDASTARRGMRLVIPMETSGGEGQKKSNSKPSSPRKSGKSILVDISEQHVYAYEGKKLVLDFDVSTGRNGSTASGTFSILDKIPDAWSAPWGFWMPHWMGIYYVSSDLENGFHSLPVLLNGQEIWGDELGVPISYGCVVLDQDDMKSLYDWAEIGTPVFIRP